MLKRRAPGFWRKHLTRRWALVSAVVFLIAAGAGFTYYRVSYPPIKTNVTLGFDDGYAEQYTIARNELDKRGLKGTFYVTTDLVGTPGYMTWDQIDQIAHDGHEIGGHTLTHPHLSQLDDREQINEMCGNRDQLISRGYDVRTMALPFGDFGSSTQDLAKACGYNAVRGVGGESPTGDQNQTVTETVPPANPYLTRAEGSVSSTNNSLAALQAMVTGGERTGGWVQITFHHICDGCGDYSVAPTVFGAFLDWLSDRRSMGTAVRTASAVVGGPSRPEYVPTARPNLTNASLERDDDNDGVPDCWQKGQYGNNTAQFTRTNDALFGGFAERVDVAGYRDGDAKLVVGQQGCAPPVIPGHRYVLTAWAKGNAPASFTIYYRNANGEWTVNHVSPPIPLSAQWQQIAYHVPAVPAGTVAMSFGLGLNSDGSMTMDGFTLGDDGQAFPSEITNASVEQDGDNDGVPDCFEVMNGDGTASTVAKRTRDGFTGTFAAQLNVVSPINGPRGLELQPTNSCAMDVNPGRSYELSTRYQATVPVKLVLHYYDDAGQWKDWEPSADFPPSDAWQEARFVTPPLPADAHGLTWSLAISTVGSVSTDTYYGQELP